MAPPRLPRLTPTTRLRHDRVRDRWVLLAPERGFILNRTALAIVQSLDGNSSAGEIAERLGGPIEDVERIVSQLSEAGLLE
jgi:pyrroloquinoline quinone biosynthesis protein D